MPKPPTKLAEVMITTYYGKRPLRWIGDQLGCSAPTVLAYAKRLGLSQPTPDKLKLPRFRGVELDLGDYGSVVTASIAAS